jgi:hypothetical protein
MLMIWTTPLVQTLQELGKTISRNVMISGVGANTVDDDDSYYFAKWIEEPRNNLDEDLVMSPISDATKLLRVHPNVHDHVLPLYPHKLLP